VPEVTRQCPSRGALGIGHIFPGPRAAEYEVAREKPREAVLERGYDARLGAFTQRYGHASVDAAALLIPITGAVAAYHFGQGFIDIDGRYLVTPNPPTFMLLGGAGIAF
jgi:hypothetical protein